MKTQVSNIDGKSTLVALAFVTICTIVGAYNTFYLLIFVSICSGMILYDDFTKPEGGAFRKSIHFKTVGTIPVSKQKF